jgi:hypothetical protein
MGAFQGPADLAVGADVQAEGILVAAHRFQVVDHIVRGAARPLTRRRRRVVVAQHGAGTHPLPSSASKAARSASFTMRWKLKALM